MEGVRRYDSQLCYFKWIGMLLYLSFNNTFKDVYNVLGLVMYEGQLNPGISATNSRLVECTDT